MANTSSKYDLVIIGGGPAGYVAAIRGAQLGAKVCLVEKEKLGGTCLNIGCIPTKALYKSADLLKSIQNAEEYGIKVEGAQLQFDKIIQRKERVVGQLVNGVSYLVKKHGITHITGTAQFVGKDIIQVERQGETENITGDKFLIATGSVNAIPPVPGVEGINVIDSTEALSLSEVPESLVVMGGGVIGCEFAAIYRAFGSEVTIIEMLPNLVPSMDKDCCKALEQAMKKQGVSVNINSKVQSISNGNKGKKVVSFQNGETVKEVEADKVLIATGRKPCIHKLGLEAADVKFNKGGIEVDRQMRTSNPHIFAAGDVTGEQLFAHVAYDEAEVAVQNALGTAKTMEYNAVPKAIFTFPEIASAGLTEEEAKEQGYDVTVGQFALRGNGKALILGETDGFVKVVAEKQYNQILGVHIVGPHASELIAEAVALIDIEATLEDVEAAIHPHPSLTEAVKEAALDALGRVLHA